MNLVSSFLKIVQQVSWVMTVPSFASFVTMLTGWIFARRRTITGMILAADAVGIKHHSAFHRLFAAARWSLDQMGLAVFDLIKPWLDDEPIFRSGSRETRTHKRLASPPVFKTGSSSSRMTSVL